VHKPASATPISAIRMARIFEECGLPAGALNVVTGPGGAIGDMLVFDSRVAMVTFTGSVDVGLRIRNLAGMKRVTLELGSNSAVIVEDDADLDEAVLRCVAGSFAHSGQVCISVQRIYVNAKIRNEFTERFVERARKLHIGHPHSSDTDVSSLITEGEARRVESWIAEAVEAGAKLVSGGARTGSTIEPGRPSATSRPARRWPRGRRSVRWSASMPTGRSTRRSPKSTIPTMASRPASIPVTFTRPFEAARRVHVGGL